MWLIPPVAVLVLWRRRRTILAESPRGSWLGTALVLAGAMIVVAGEITALYRLQAIAAPLLLAFLALAALGRDGMRLAWVPLLFLLFAVPLPGTVYTPLSLGLQLVSSKLGTWMLTTLGVSVYLDGNVIDLGTYKLQVAEACNGLRYLFPLATFGFLCTWMYRAPFWARAILLLSTVPITIVMNSARIAFTGLIVEYGDPTLADGFMHLFEGWVVFLVALSVLALEMWLLAGLIGWRGGFLDLLDFERLHGPAAPPLSLRPVAGPPAPFVAAVGFLLGAALAQAAFGVAPKSPPYRPGLVTLPLELGDWRGRTGIPDADALRVLDLDDYALVDYVAPGNAAPVNLWVSYYASQRGPVAPHSPDVCLPGAGWVLTEREVVQSPDLTEMPRGFQLNRGVFTNGDNRLLVYFWLEQRGRQLADWAPLKWLVLWDLLIKGRTDGALVRLATPIEPNETVAQAEQRLSRFFQAAYPRLMPHVGV